MERPRTDLHDEHCTLNDGCDRGVTRPPATTGPMKGGFDPEGLSILGMLKQAVIREMDRAQVGDRAEFKLLGLAQRYAAHCEEVGR